MRKEKINITERFKTDRGEKKEVLNLVVVGKMFTNCHCLFLKPKF